MVAGHRLFRKSDFVVLYEVEDEHAYPVLFTTFWIYDKYCMFFSFMNFWSSFYTNLLHFLGFVFCKIQRN